MAIDGISSDPLPDVLQARLRELALQKYTSEVPLPEANVRSVELEVSIAQADIFLAIQDERLRRLTAPYERRRNHRASEGRLGLFDQDFVARLVRVESLKRGIRSRRHSEQEAVEASTEITFVGLPSIEQRAAEIVLSRRRAARNNPAILHRGSPVRCAANGSQSPLRTGRKKAKEFHLTSFTVSQSQILPLFALRSRFWTNSRESQ